MATSVAKKINTSLVKGLVRLRDKSRDDYDSTLVRLAVNTLYDNGNEEVHSKALGVLIGIAGIEAKKGKPAEFGRYVGTVHENRMYDLLKGVKGVYKPTPNKATWRLRPSMVKQIAAARAEAQQAHDEQVTEPQAAVTA